MRTVHVKFFGELGICDHAVKILRQCAVELVVDAVMTVAVCSRNQKNDRADEEHPRMIRDELGDSAELRHEISVRGLVDRAFKNQDHRGQDRYTGDHAADNALCHDNAQIHAERECHEAHCEESGDRRERAADDRGDRIRNRLRHCLYLVIGILRKLFLVTVPEENGVVHCHAELQNHRERLCDKRNLAEEHIRSEIPDHREADAQHEEYRNEERIHRQQQNDRCQQNGDRRIDQRFALRQILHVQRDRGHTADEALLCSDRTHLLNGRKRTVCGGRIIEENSHHGRIIVIEEVIDLLRQDLLRDRAVGQRLIADDIGNMVDR